MTEEIHITQRSRIAAELDFYEQLKAALVAHGEWKFRLAKGIDVGCLGLEPEKIRVDNQCVFGQWLYSDKTQPYRNNSHYEKVRQLHAEFHKEAANVVVLCHEGHTHEAKRALDSRYADISKRLAEAIDTWLKDITKKGIQNQQEEQQSTSNLEISRYARYGLCIGILSGFGFVFLSLFLIFWQNSWDVNFQNLIQAHVLNWAQWVVDCAPFVLGSVGYFLGRYFGINKTESIRLEKVVKQRTAELLANQKEMKLIRDNLNEGVFFLDRERKIGSQFSPVLKEIFEQTELSGFTLLEVFRGRIDETTAQELAGYLDLMFDKTHSETMLSSLNPFNPLVLPEVAGLDEKILRVLFKRIINENGSIEGLLGIASDITKQVKAEREAERQRELAKRQMELIGQILETGPQMLLLFRQQTDSALKQVATLLEQASEEKEMGILIDEIYRHIHTIKGSASLLKLKDIAHAAHVYEEELTKLKQKKDISTLDFLPLSIKQGNLMKQIEEFEKLIERIQQFQISEKQSAREEDLLLELVRRAVEAAAQETNKELLFTASGFEVVQIPTHYFEPLRAILIQFVRNSAAHGIETPEEREAQQKPRQGQITLTVDALENDYRLVYSDDGRGIDPEKVKTRAVERNLLTAEDAQKLTTQEIYKLLFKPGFSTAQETNMTAGRGVGLDIVLEEVKKLGGKLTLRSTVGKGSEFIITLPKAA